MSDIIVHKKILPKVFKGDNEFLFNKSCKILMDVVFI
jgi:hypothetical protein